MSQKCDLGKMCVTSYLKSVHDSEPREDVINTPWCLASISQPVRKTRQKTQDFTPPRAAAALGGHAI